MAHPQSGYGPAMGSETGGDEVPGQDAPSVADARVVDRARLGPGLGGDGSAHGGRSFAVADVGLG